MSGNILKKHFEKKYKFENCGMVNKNKFITISASDLAEEITENSTSIFYYPDEDSDKEELMLSDKVNVIYNDKAGSLKNPLTGTITLLETTRDDKYDTVFINEYVNYVVDSTSSASKNKYNAKAYDRINLTVPKGQKEKLSAHAEARGESLNGFIKRAIEETIKRDTTEE